MGSMCSTESTAEGPNGAGRRTAPDDNDGRRASRMGGEARQPSRTGNVTRRKVFTLSSLGGRDSERGMPRKVNKSEDDRRILRTALQNNTVLSALNSYELDEMIDFMDVVPIKAGQGCNLSGCLCVVLEGAVVINPDLDSDDSDGYAGGERFVGRGDRHDVFGQVGLFYDASRALSGGGGLHAVSESEQSRICKLPGSAYRAAMEFSRQANIKANMKLLSSIPIFSKMSVAERVKICDASHVVSYRKNDAIIREGEAGDVFYILSSGGAKVFRGVDKKSGHPKQIDYKYQGDFFGEAALLHDAPRNATLVADEHNTECLLVDRGLFNEQLLGPLKDIMELSLIHI